MEKLKCSKDLFMEHGEQSFTKNKEYPIVADSQIFEKVKVLDDQDEEHILGNWNKHFKRVKS